jgi:hypothetical protein
VRQREGKAVRKWFTNEFDIFSEFVEGAVVSPRNLFLSVWVGCANSCSLPAEAANTKVHHELISTTCDFIGISGNFGT